MKLRKKITRAIEFPENALGGSSHIEIDSDSGMKINACEAIISYEEVKIKLQLCDQVITVYGKNLTMKSFHGSVMMVTGEISEIEFGDKV